VSNIVQQPNTLVSDGAIKGRLVAQTSDERRVTLTTYVENAVLAVMHSAVRLTRADLAKGFIAVGVDSMRAIELVYKFEDDLGITIEPQALEINTVSELVEYLLAQTSPAAEG